MASLARRRMQQSRIVLTVPGIIIMVPGIYGFQTIVLLNQGDMLYYRINAAPLARAAVLGLR